MRSLKFPSIVKSVFLFFLIGCSTDAKQSEEQSASANEELYPFCREPSYFEIPTKECQQASQVAESTIHEIPTKDTQSSHTAASGHASFTIEFDDNTPGKVKIKDHVTKFTSEQRHKSKKPSSSSGQDLPGLQTVMMAAESKVADWLAQNNPPRMIWEPTEEDSKSIKSDVPVYLKRLKGKVNSCSYAYSESNNSPPVRSQRIPEPLRSSDEIADTPHVCKDLGWEILLLNKVLQRA